MGTCGQSAVYVVDTGDEDIYVIADSECEAAEHAAALVGHEVNYAEHYSDNLTDLPY